MPQTTHQLAAIMFTDIVGYTTLMGEDSEKALDTLYKSRDIQKPLIEKHGGKWLKEMGDGVLAQFNSAIDAVQCALEIQKSAHSELFAKIRIGIDLGDVTFELEDVFGEGVNIASRLQAVADPGGIYISESVVDAIGGRGDIKYQYFGEVKLKNVAHPIKTYCLEDKWLPIPSHDKIKELSVSYISRELKRRNVLRATLVYILTALLIWKGAGVVGLPQNISGLIPFILIVLFPIAVLMAWLYERSPQGFIRRGSAASRENPFTYAKKKPLMSNTFIILLVAAVAVLFLIYPESSTKQQATSEEINKSIAVLPFVNMSDDPDQLYFSDGIMEAILNHLTKIKDLKVISRTSVMQYRNTEKTIPQIAQELGVAYILEGGVQRYEDQVRINAQLIEAKTDKHVWSDNYDREFINIFDIQSEVAQQIANILQATIDPEVIEQLESKLTENTEAYNLYLEATFILSNFFDQTQYKKGYELLEKAIVLDLDFALAYTRMADYWIHQGIFTGDLEREKVLKEALPLLEKSLKLDDKETTTHQTLANIYLYFQWDFEKAEMEYKKIKELSPSYVISQNYLLASGRYQEALVESTKRTKNDMNNPGAWASHGLSLYFTDHSEESLATFEQAIRVFPNSTNLVSEAGRGLIFLNEHHKAIKILEPHLNKLDRRPPRDVGYLAIAYYKNDQNSKFDDILEELKQMSQESSVGSPAFYIAMLYAQMREMDLAFEWLDKAYQEHEVEMVWLKVEPPFEPLRSDPRWQEMLDKVGFLD